MIWDFMNPHKISANSDNKQKSFIPQKNIMHVSTRDFTIFELNLISNMGCQKIKVVRMS